MNKLIKSPIMPHPATPSSQPNLSSLLMPSFQRKPESRLLINLRAFSLFLCGFFLCGLSLSLAATAIGNVKYTSSVQTPQFVTDGGGGTDPDPDPGTNPNSQLDIAIRNISDDASATAIGWSNVVSSETAWKLADQYFTITPSGVNLVGYGIQIYTNNVAVSANPRYMGALVSGLSVAGLLEETASRTTAVLPLPLAWHASDSKLDLATKPMAIKQGSVCNKATYAYRLWSPYFDNPQTSEDEGQCFPAFLWMLDRSNLDTDAALAGDQPFQDGAEYISIWNSIKGLQIGEATWYRLSAPYYIYLAADFTRATGGKAYSTNSLTVEIFHE